MSGLNDHSDATIDSIERLLSARAIWLLVAGAVLAFQAFLIWNHEPWADELQALMIALEAPDHQTLLAWLRYEGHPPLWYWLLRGLGSMAEPHIVLPIAATLCAAVTQGLILFAAPFARIERVLIALSQFVLFEFLTISRGTSLGVALVMLGLVLWRSRWLWAVMALMPLVDFLFGVLSGVFLVLKWREKDLWWPGIALWLAASAFAAWTVIPASDMVSAHEAMSMPSGPWLWAQQVTALLIPFQGGINPQWNTPVVPLSAIGWIGFLALCWFATRSRPWHAAVMFGFLGFTLAFSLAVYPIGLRHLMLAALLLIALNWLARRDGEKPSAAFRGWIALAAVCGVASSLIATHRGFDSAGAALAVIDTRGLAQKHWIALPEWRVPALAGRSDMRFTRPEQDCTFRFVRWNHRSAAFSSREALSAVLARHIELYGKSYLVSDRELSGFDPALLAPLETIPKGYDGIAYHLYVIGSQAPEKQSELPFCHTTRPNTAKPARSLGKK